VKHWRVREGRKGKKLPILIFVFGGVKHLNSA
jgi:hypothetical protein